MKTVDVNALLRMGCRSSVAGIQVAKARDTGFDSPVTTEIFFTFYLRFSFDPFR